MELLQFSGGIDSLACLELLKDRPHLCVATVSTDGAYPERAEYLGKVASNYPQFEFINVTTSRYLDRFGQPVDVVPVKFTLVGGAAHNTSVKYQPYYECCSRALWKPMSSLVDRLGATVIYRGQRGDDARKAPVRDGYVENGITYRFPIQDWGRAKVEDFVRSRVPHLIPSYYATESTSRDCWDCTAYLGENKSRILNLPPDKQQRVIIMLEEWRKDVAEEMRW